VNRTHCGRRYATSPLSISIALAFAPIAPNAFALGSDTVFINGNAGVIYDSNVFKLSSSYTDEQVQSLTQHSEKDDTIFTIGAGLTADVPYSRQRFQANLQVNDYQYSRFSYLDYLGGSGRGAWLWQVGDDWSGDLGATVSRSLQRYAYTQTTQKNVIDTISYFFDPKYRIAPNWELQGGASYTTIRNSLELADINDTNNATFYGATRYITPSGNSVGLKLATSAVRLPNVSLDSSIDNAYREYRLSTEFDWAFSGASKIDGSWGYVERKHENLSDRDFSGWTGSAGWTWNPTAKSTVRMSLVRNIGGIEDVAVTYARTYIFTITPTYQLTSKVSLNGTLQHQDVRFLGSQNTGVTNSFTDRHDRLNVAGVGANYQATRTLQFGLNYTWSHRNSSVQFGDYNDNVVSLTGQLTF
jgi:exopolysaccharide biosynthesis operon protein EpsL